MHRLIFSFAFFTISMGLIAQETRTEVTNPAITKNDARPNSDSVPNAYAVPGKFERILVLRMKYQSDLLDGIDSLVKREKIRNAVILSGIGSVRNYRYHVVSNRTFPSSDAFVSNPTEPADIASMNGYIIEGRVHAHITFSDRNGAFGGHLERGTNVFTFAIVTIGIFDDDIDLKRVDDKTYR